MNTMPPYAELKTEIHELKQEINRLKATIQEEMLMTVDSVAISEKAITQRLKFVDGGRREQFCFENDATSEKGSGPQTQKLLNKYFNNNSDSSACHSDQLISLECLCAHGPNSGKNYRFLYVKLKIYIVLKKHLRTHWLVS